MGCALVFFPLGSWFLPTLRPSPACSPHHSIKPRQPPSPASHLPLISVAI
uniref:Uncharacterized protein n=1 Tax=Anguilla anguilla TaxID=7936 RepID=A0A0E9Y0I9_ANGAN